LTQFRSYTPLILKIDVGDAVLIGGFEFSDVGSIAYDLWSFYYGSRSMSRAGLANRLWFTFAEAGLTD
jgi:hypothetical protein